MTKKPENPPAFPSQHTTIESAEGCSVAAKLVSVQGMTLRDYFAGLAMQSLVASSINKIFNDNKMPIEPFDYMGLVVGAAYNYADAMLKAREEEEDEQ